MKCPVHPEEDLIETRPREGGRIGFCPKCPRNYDLCRETKYMDICDKLIGHEGDHESEYGLKWNDIKPYP
jgi:hypothetical protein